MSGAVTWSHSPGKDLGMRPAGSPKARKHVGFFLRTIFLMPDGAGACGTRCVGPLALGKLGWFHTRWGDLVALV